MSRAQILQPSVSQLLAKAKPERQAVKAVMTVMAVMAVMQVMQVMQD